MATRKTVKKSPAAPKKTTTKRSSTVKTKLPKSNTSTNSRSMTVSELRKKVLNPKNRRSLFIAIAIIVLAAVIYFGKGLVFAAMVNGEPVSRLSIIHDLEQQSGKAALDAAVTRMLVMQQADKKHIVVTDKEIDAEIAKIKKQFADQGQNLDELLSTQGLTTEKFRDEVKVQLIVEKILGSQAKVTDKEFADFLAKNQDLISSEKDQNTAKANLRTQMEQQKLAQKYQDWIATIKKNAKIMYFVNY